MRLMMKIQILLRVLFFIINKGTAYPSEELYDFDFEPKIWCGAQKETDQCTAENKQKAMYLSYAFQPTLVDKPATEASVVVEWNKYDFAPWMNDQPGAIYAAYPIGMKGGLGGYFGVIIDGDYKEKGGKFMFSIWDDRDKEKKQPARALSWPLANSCKRNCQDCGKKKEGLGISTGTQCRAFDRNMEVGDRYELRLKRENTITVKTDFTKGGGESKLATGNTKLGENGKDITGGKWSLIVTKERTGETFNVGSILCEKDGEALTRLNAFDEMVGCNKCNNVYHKDTRYGPYILDGNGETRTPVTVKGTSRAKIGTCKKFGISGNKGKVSVTFEGGPGVSTTFDPDKKYVVWE